MFEIVTNPKRFIKACVKKAVFLVKKKIPSYLGHRILFHYEMRVLMHYTNEINQSFQF